MSSSRLLASLLSAPMVLSASVIAKDRGWIRVAGGGWVPWGVKPGISNLPPAYNQWMFVVKGVPSFN